MEKTKSVANAAKHKGDRVPVNLYINKHLADWGVEFHKGSEYGSLSRAIEAELLKRLRRKLAISRNRGHRITRELLSLLDQAA